ncbi:MAG: metalloregulator ArsR/SmtB family transcription factor [Halofilum sp. (in: g-proteobacteria)]|nr:metalloregulator ArsR/SmtB family transcription factor [Halofilum sp. (in: g-proteobacteria)]
MKKRLRERDAAASFDALGHEVRLRIFRLLVRAGDDGANVGHIGQALDLPASTLAHHLHTLVNAGLVRQQRHGREIINHADYTAVNALTAYLTEECCVDAGRRRDSAA